MYGKLLLAGVLRWERKQVEKVIAHRDDYHKILIPKKHGKRTIYTPYPILKQFQRRFLKYFLYRTLHRNWMNRNIMGFMPKKSIGDNAHKHLRPEMRFVYSFDFKNAFPSITSKHLGKMFEEIFFEEINEYARVVADRKIAGNKQIRFPNPPLFSSRKVKWFRKMFNPPSEYIGAHQVDPHIVVHEFVAEIIPLLTYQGKLPQGAPTSPYLLNMVVSRSRILENIQNSLREMGIGCTISIYADDITISSARALPRPAIEKIHDIVEATGIFHLHPQKTRCYKRDRGAPLVTGLRVVRYKPTKLQRDLIYRAAENKPWDKIARPIYETPMWGKTGKVNIILTVSLPKKTIKKIRGLIYRAIFQPKLRPMIEGQIAYLRSIYGYALPNQIQKPYQKYLETTKRQAV